MKGWYLLYCKPRSERRAQLNLGMQGLETYLPMISVTRNDKAVSSVKKSPLFPNYLFVNFDPSNFSLSKIRSTRGVASIVSCSNELTPLDDILITRLKYEELLAPERSARDFKRGEQVQIISGPFSDLTGVFLEKNGDKRCRVLFELLGSLQSLEFAISDIECVLA